jgi:cell shape-determining protein MreC
MFLTSITSKVFGISTGILLIVCATIYFTMSSANGRLAEKNSQLSSKVVLLETALSQSELALEEMEKDKQLIEKVLTDRINTEKRIRREFEQKLKKESARVVQLRRENEELDKFLDIIVPDVFVDNFMRKFDGTYSDNEN